MQKLNASIKNYKALALLSLVVVFSAAALAALHDVPPFGKWQRASSEPILRPGSDARSFESAGVFNPAVVEKDGQVIMLYRAQDHAGTSRLGYASSADGIHFTRRAEPVLVPEAEYERDGGVEDPRLVKIDGTYYLTYTAYNKKDAQLCLASSSDLIHWERQGVILPAYQGKWNVGWTKAGAILNQKLDGKYWMYFQGELPHRPSQMGVAYSSDLIHWTEALDHPVMQNRPGYFDSKVVEPGPAPFLVPEGILLVYNAADDNDVFATGWVLFDKSDPTKILARSDKPIFGVKEEWEKIGQVPSVVFVEGMLWRGNRWMFYYGAADKYIGVAVAKSRGRRP